MSDMRFVVHRASLEMHSSTVMGFPACLAEGFGHVALINLEEGLKAPMIIRVIRFTLDCIITQFLADHEKALTVPQPDVCVSSSTNVPLANHETVLRNLLDLDCSST